MWPQLNPTASQTDINAIKAPGPYPYDLFSGPIPKAPYPNAWNLKTIEVGGVGRYSQIVRSGDTGQMFF